MKDRWLEVKMLVERRSFNSSQISSEWHEFIPNSNKKAAEDHS